MNATVVNKITHTVGHSLEMLHSSPFVTIAAFSSDFHFSKLCVWVLCLNVARMLKKLQKSLCISKPQTVSCSPQNPAGHVWVHHYLGKWWHWDAWDNYKPVEGMWCSGQCSAGNVNLDVNLTFWYPLFTPKWREKSISGFLFSVLTLLYSLWSVEDPTVD